jgi:hypothetical protein
MRIGISLLQARTGVHLARVDARRQDRILHDSMGQTWYACEAHITYWLQYATASSSLLVEPSSLSGPLHQYPPVPRGRSPPYSLAEPAPPLVPCGCPLTGSLDARLFFPDPALAEWPPLRPLRRQSRSPARSTRPWPRSRSRATPTPSRRPAWAYRIPTRLRRSPCPPTTPRPPTPRSSGLRSMAHAPSLAVRRSAWGAVPDPLLKCSQWARCLLTQKVRLPAAARLFGTDSAT